MKSFEAEVRMDGERRHIRVTGPDGKTRSYEIARPDHEDYLDFFVAVAEDFGTRCPRNRTPRAPVPSGADYRALLTENISPRILYGYGDPAVRWVEEESAWYMAVTSNDAPDAFPILRTSDLEEWETVAFAFPEGRTPEWALDGLDAADYWAPELIKAGEQWLLCFSAREHDDSLSIGIATAPAPQGPFSCPEEPLLRGDMIDAHIFRDKDGRLILYWKDDSNRVWPPALARLMHADPELIPSLFERDEDRRTASLAAALWPCLKQPAHMERFFSLQPLIEATAENFTRVRERLEEIGSEDALKAVRAMSTPIYAQRLSDDGLSLVGESKVVLKNDLDWEAHLIEGPWLTYQHDRYWLFYAGNDFSTAEYGVGVAVADDPFGPFEKMPQPLIRSTAEWEGPGHPSVAPGPDGGPAIFFHAYFPGCVGYNEFRALLMAPLSFSKDEVTLR